MVCSRSRPDFEREGEIYRREVERLKLRIKQFREEGKYKEANRVEQFLNDYLNGRNFCMYPFAAEGTTVSRRKWVKEQKKP